MSGAVVRPMLAGKFDATKQQYPCYVQPKYDGIRAIIKDGVALSRTLKPIRNRHIQSEVAKYPVLEGCDGEFVIGDPTVEDCFRLTTSGVMSEAGKPDFRYYIFDLWNVPKPFEDRNSIIADAFRYYADESIMPEWIRRADTFQVVDEAELLVMHQCFVEQGYEGTIIRAPEGLYKYNRSTTNEGLLLKLKDFEDAEAVIIGFEEKMHNGNEATVDARGYTARTVHKENMVPCGTLGALIVSADFNGMGSDFNIGTGFDDALRQKIWNNQAQLKGAVVKFKYFKGGKYDLPRFPVFVGFRDPMDMDA